MKSLLWANLGLAVANNLQIRKLNRNLHEEISSHQKAQEEQTRLTSMLLIARRGLEEHLQTCEDFPRQALISLAIYRAWVHSEGIDTRSFTSMAGQEAFMKTQELAGDIEARASGYIRPEERQQIYSAAAAQCAIPYISKRRAAAQANQLFRKTIPKQWSWRLIRVSMLTLGFVLAATFRAIILLIIPLILRGAFEIFLMIKAWNQAKEAMKVVGVEYPKLTFFTFTLAAGKIWKEGIRSTAAFEEKFTAIIRSFADPVLAAQPIEQIEDAFLSRVANFQEQYPALLN